jgi:hypothetical protein
MKRRIPFTLAGKLTVAGLVVAGAGVLIQIVSGVAYPKVPPVFFILAVPAVLVAFGPWRWTPVVSVVVGLFLINGLFRSGAWARLIDASRLGGIGGSGGLWVQMLGVLAATVAAIVATLQNYRSRTSVSEG